MDAVLLISMIVLGAALIVVAYLGSILPALPGAPIAYASLWCLQFSGVYSFHWTILVLLALFVIVVAVLDYVLPIVSTKYFGGSKAGVRGSAVGVIVGTIATIWLGPFCIIIGPFLGALFGEKIAGKSWKESFKAGLGSLIGFLLGTVGKLLVVTLIAIVFIWGAVAASIQYFNA